MVTIEDANRNKLGNSRRAGSGKDYEAVPPHKIIVFQSSRKRPAKTWLESDRTGFRLVERSRLSGRLPDDWIELWVVVAVLFALLAGLYAG